MSTAVVQKQEPPERRTYGNWRAPGFTVFGVGVIPALTVFLTVSGAVWLMMMQWYLVMALALALLVFVELPLVWPSPAGTRWLRLARWSAFRWSRLRGTDALVQGPTGKALDGTTRLPGVGVNTSISEFSTSLGDRFGMVSWPKAKVHSVVMACHPTGRTGRDQAQVDRMVAEYGHLLRLLGNQGDVAGAAAIVETAPDSGLRLRRAGTAGEAEHRSRFSDQVMNETLEEMSSALPGTRAWFSITFRGVESKSSTRARPVRVVGEDLGARLPHILGQARITGAGGTARWCDAQEIIDITRAAYDPAIAHEIERQRIEGAGTGLTWEDVGPVSAATKYREYAHEGALSRTWVWVRPPQGAQTEEVLTNLMAANPAIRRKRVTILYRPMTADESQSYAAMGVKAARFGGEQRRRWDARASSDYSSAEKAESEVTTGAVMVRSSVLITVTAFDEDELGLAAQTVEQMVKQTLKIRIAKGTQDSSFLAALPIGFSIPAHLQLADSIRDQV